MKLLLAFALFALCVTRSLAALAPESLGGVLLESTTFTMAHGYHSCALALTSDGTFSELYHGGYDTTPSPYRLSAPGQGTYLYQRIDDTTAELKLIWSDGTEQMEMLTFTSATNAESHTPGAWTFHRLAQLAAPAAWANTSNRTFVRAGSSALAGFVLTEKRTVLVRAIGPGLKKFGVREALRTPVLQLSHSASSSTTLVSNSDWSAESALSITRTSALVGAFPLDAGSMDAATIRELDAGVYSAQVTSSDPEDAGEALIEIYLLP